MIKKFCALKRLGCLEKCSFSCDGCTWSMTSNDLDKYTERQEANFLEIKAKGKYKHYKGVKR